MFWDAIDGANAAPALIDEAGQTSHAELHAARERIAAELGGGDKKLAFVLCDNSVRAIVAYAGLLRSGHAVALLDPRTPRPQLLALRDRYRPEIVWQPTADEMVHAMRAIEIDGTKLWVSRAHAGEVHRDLAVLLTTSGSTGSPKMVRLSYTNLRSNADAIADYLRLSPTERAVTSLPLSYSYGLSVLHSHHLVGASVVCTNRSFLQREFWTLASEQQCTSFAGVPFIYDALRRLDLDATLPPTLRTMTQAGGALSPALQKHFAEACARRGRELVVMYGQTEATARMAYVPPTMLLQKLGSIGVAIPGGEITIVDDELVYRGSNVMLGYAEAREDLALGDVQDGVLHTGDLGRVDEDGYFYVTGRNKRFLKLFGVRTSLDEIQDMLEQQLGRPVACVGRDDLLVVAVESRNDTDATAAARAVIDAYGFHHSAVRARCVASIPRSAAGKKLYQQLSDQLLA